MGRSIDYSNNDVSKAYKTTFKLIRMSCNDVNDANDANEEKNEQKNEK